MIWIIKKIGEDSEILLDVQDFNWKTSFFLIVARNWNTARVYASHGSLTWVWDSRLYNSELTFSFVFEQMNRIWISMG
jgi:hypothetical protein